MRICIHNVINVDDITTYVAPSGWGFKRYGVDHYLNDEKFDSNNLCDSSLFSNNKADNNCYAKTTDQRLFLVEKHITNLVNNAKEKQENMPFTLSNKRLTRDGFGIAVVDDTEHDLSTSSRLENFMTNCARE